MEPSVVSFHYPVILRRIKLEYSCKINYFCSQSMPCPPLAYLHLLRKLTLLRWHFSLRVHSEFCISCFESYSQRNSHEMFRSLRFSFVAYELCTFILSRLSLRHSYDFCVTINVNYRFCAVFCFKPHIKRNLG